MAADEGDQPRAEDPPAPPRPQRKGGAAETTGRLAGKMAAGLGGALLRNRTVRKTIRRAREEARGEGPPTAP